MYVCKNAITKLNALTDLAKGREKLHFLVLPFMNSVSQQERTALSSKNTQM